MGRRLSQLNQIYQLDQLDREDYLLVDGEDYLESKKIQFKDIDIDKFNTENFYNRISENFVEKEQNKGLSTNDFTNEDKDKLDNSQEKLISGTNVKTINGQSILGQGNIEIQSGGSSGIVDVDQDYNPTSSNAQSGIAVNQAVKNKTQVQFVFWEETD